MTKNSFYEINKTDNTFISEDELMKKVAAVDNKMKKQPYGGYYNNEIPKHDPTLTEILPGTKAGEIIQVAAEGFMLHDRLLRPAQVGVSSMPAS